MCLQFLTIGQNLKWPRWALCLAGQKTWKKNYDSRFSCGNIMRRHIILALTEVVTWKALNFSTTW